MYDIFYTLQKGQGFLCPKMPANNETNCWIDINPEFSNDC